MELFFGDEFRREREAQGWTLDLLAEISGVASPIQSRYERGDYKLPGDSLRRLLVAFHQLRLLRKKFQDLDVPIDYRDFAWVKRQIEAMNVPQLQQVKIGEETFEFIVGGSGTPGEPMTPEMAERELARLRKPAAPERKSKSAARSGD
jgi:transcriptional regulator with XRE-family HTH domain